MKNILLIIGLFVFFSASYSQEKKRYLVLTFSNEWKHDSTGEYMWIVPFDSLHGVMKTDKLIFLCAHHELRQLVEDNYVEGRWPIWDYSPSDSIDCFLLGNRRLIQQTESKIKFVDGETNTSDFRIYLVPIYAKCKKLKINIENSTEVIIFDGMPEVWSDFWKLESHAIDWIWHFDYRNFDFQLDF